MNENVKFQIQHANKNIINLDHSNLSDSKIILDNYNNILSMNSNEK